MVNNMLLNMIKSVSVQQYKTDVAFRTLVEGVNENLYIIPKYQRKYRWSREQVTALVESLICGLPIPPIYTCRNECNQLEILDGQQRIMSLFFYYIGYYLNKRKSSSINFSELVVEDCTFKEALLKQFELEELHINLIDKNSRPVNVDYAALPVELKRRIDYTMITVIEIKVDDEKRKPEVLRQIFSNLNRGGSLLSAQEQRNGIYVCRFYDMLQRFNRKNENWRNIWGREDAEERDLEALLRLCALRRFVSIKETCLGYDFVIENYKSSYIKMLDQFSEEAMGFSDKEIDEYKESLSDFLELIRVNNRWSSKIALLESFYIIYEKMKFRKPVTSKIYDSIIKDSRYIANTRQGTVKFKKMNERWKVVYEIWNRENGPDN